MNIIDCVFLFVVVDKVSKFSLSSMNLQRRWNWDTLVVQCYRTYLIERCSKLGLLLGKSPKRNSQWRNRSLGLWPRLMYIVWYSTWSLKFWELKVCDTSAFRISGFLSGLPQWTHLLAGYLGWEQEYKICTNGNPSLKDPKHFCDKAAEDCLDLFSILTSLIVMDAMAVEIMGMFLSLFLSPILSL